MTLTQAFKRLSESTAFRDIAKKKDALGSKYRVYLRRFKKGELKAGAITELLLENGYEVHAKRVRKTVKH